MIKILTTSYLDQSQAIGLNPILEYYGDVGAHRLPPSFFREPVDVIEYAFEKRRMILKEDNEILEILAAIMPSLN